MRQTAVSERSYVDTRDYTSGSKTNTVNADRSQTGETQGVRATSQSDARGDSVYYDVSQGASRVAGIMINASYLSGESATAEEAVEEDQSQDQQKKAAGYTQEDVDEMERLLERMKESNSSSTSTSSSTKKKLTYNYKRVSSAIMRSKTRMQANGALRSAKSTLADLKRKAGSGQYSDDELEIAITHANKMIRTARKKVANLSQEEAQDKSDQDVEQDKERDNTAVRQQHIQKEDFQELDVELDKELQLLKKQLKQLSKTEKNGHRQNENFDLLMADMEYLKRKIDLMRQDDSSGQTTGQITGFSETGTATETGIATSWDSVGVTDTSSDTAGQDTTVGASIDVSV